jgi:serine/threonine protein kinase
VALKVLAGDLSSSEEFVERFRREGRLQASLDHPHAVRVYEAGESEYGLYLAIRLFGGTTLGLLLQERAMDVARTIALLRQVADALDAVHAAGLIHRDVKPQNILVDESSNAYLGDFGLARVGSSAGMTATGRLMGTVAYLAPEVIRQGGDAGDRRYSFAVTAFECLTGTRRYLGGQRRRLRSTGHHP